MIGDHGHPLSGLKTELMTKADVEIPMFLEVSSIGAQVRTLGTNIENPMIYKMNADGWTIATVPRGGTYRLRLESRRGDVLGRIAMSKSGKHIVALAALGLALMSPVRAQDTYPSRPIQLVVTTAAGGALDLVARTVADRLSDALHQPVIIENQPAGNGSVAAGQFAKAAPDGHTLMMVVD